jgi:hypothetical protein
MTKIMLAQASSSMHHKLGLDDANSRQHDAEEALFLKEAAANEDDGWDTRLRNRTSNIIQGHASIMNAGKVLQRKQSRSLSIDESMIPVAEMEHLSATAAMRLRTYKERSFGDLTAIKDEGSGCSTPTKVCWGQHQGSTDLSSVESSPRAYGHGSSALPGKSNELGVSVVE